MNKVEQFIEKQNKIISEDREKTLIALGLTEKEYSPNNREGRQYPKCDYLNGEKKYYREVAIHVTDEEYALILAKIEQVEHIKMKEEQARQKEQNRTSYRTVKKWIPIFEKPKSEWASTEKKEADNGRSKIAPILRTVAWVLGIVSIILGIVAYFETESPLPFLISLGGGGIEMLMFYVLASILDYLAELTSIARYGFKYNETSK